MTTTVIQIVYIFAQEIGMLAFIGPFLQSFSEARGAATAVFRLVDEVN